jgi:small subunit ribosomal protein S6e
MAFKIVISEPKTRKSYQIEKDLPILIGMKVGDSFDGSVLGLEGFKLQITGGSDKDGFPIRPDLPGPGRKKVLLSGPPGFNPITRGMRKRKYVRGNTISQDIMQINCKIIEGDGDIATILGIQPKKKEGE